ncbi:MAG: hypothetical protein KAJ23_03300 [Maribacter sp.]|nr:hypothetical protein [Maribacter sp.]
MTTFFTILIVLVCVNTAMMLVSLYGTNKNSHKASNNLPDAKIYPLDLTASNYKKAV